MSIVGYQYRDKTIRVLAIHTLAEPDIRPGDILLMPAVGELELNPGRADYPDEGYRSRLPKPCHGKAAPGYWRSDAG